MTTLNIACPRCNEVVDATSITTKTNRAGEQFTDCNVCNDLDFDSLLESVVEDGVTEGSEAWDALQAARDAKQEHYRLATPTPTVAAMDVVTCTCCATELTIDPSEQVDEPMCAICAASFEKYMDSMGMNDPAYLKHLEAMENEHRAI